MMFNPPIPSRAVTKPPSRPSNPVRPTIVGTDGSAYSSRPSAKCVRQAICRAFQGILTMSLSMYQASVPTILHFLDNLSAIIDKAAAHCEARKIEPSVMITARLYPDMFPMVRQVQIATDQAKGMAARLAGIDIPSFPDEEASFDDLRARIAKTVEFVKSVPPSRIDGSEDKEIVLTVGGVERKFKGRDYLFNFVLPNFYFHTTTAYGILRHNGVEIGKKDFLGVH
jgi:hypothetical protein